MGEISKRTKRLVAELTVLVCIISIMVIRSTVFDLDDVKAGVFKQVVKVDSDNVDAYRFLAGYYMDSGSYEKAADVLEKVVEIEPDDFYAHTMLGDAYWDCGRHEQAMEAYKQAMILHTDNPRVHYQIAQAYLKMGDKKSAQKEYEILKKLDEELANELFGLINE